MQVGIRPNEEGKGEGSYLKLSTMPVSNLESYALDQRLFTMYVNGKNGNKEELIQKMEKIASEEEEKGVSSNSNQPSGTVNNPSLKDRVINAINRFFGRQ